MSVCAGGLFVDSNKKLFVERYLCNTVCVYPRGYILKGSLYDTRTSFTRMTALEN